MPRRWPAAVQKKAAGTHLPGQSQPAAHVGTVCNAPEHTHAYGDAQLLNYPAGLIWLVMHVGVFVIPLIVAGMTKMKKSRPLAVVTGILGGVFFFAFWFAAQRCAFGSCT